MSANDWSGWVGRSETSAEQVWASRVAQLAATLDLDRAPRDGAPLPPGWQGLFFTPAVRQSELGADGHPRRGGFLPPIDLPRRMWAGSRLRYHEPLTVGDKAEKRSEIARIDSKEGRTGTLVFVTVRHTISQGSVIALEEEQDLVYRAPPAPGEPAPPGKPAPSAMWSEPVHPDAPLLFRYSALTFNGHRIHYDAPYASGVEGYPALVVHGPLTATLLQGLATKARPGERLATFAFRGLAPLFVDRTFHIEAAEDGEGLALWARNERGEMAMQASATFA
ncbi:MaoC family dehydratase N-terminal domain-containing protein [Leptolyngbya sp. 15MV]|nr:MaoC family dehydratase N-terminal domain-containing protein [Leptolyngbya sp. 15MV]